ncbi:MAG: HDIG domain-containing protein [Acidobacteriia bacterium]|nr:HDIG domain-containing protein [Terriglobia bacterium]
MSDPPSNPADKKKGRTGNESPFPTSLAALQKQAQAASSLPSRILQSLATPITLRDVVVGVMLIGLVVVLLARISLAPIPRYQVGELATSDLVTSDELIITNQALSRLQRDEAASRVPVVFDYDPAVLNATLLRLHTFFTESRNVLAAAGPETKVRPALAKAFENEFGRPASGALLAALSARHYDEALEQQLISDLQRLMHDSVLNDTEVLEMASPGTRIALLNIDKSGETVLPGLPPHATLARARQWLREQLLQSTLLPPEVREEFSSAAENLVAVNGLYNARETLARQRAAAQDARPVQDHIPGRTRLLRAGQPVTPDVVEALQAMREMESRRRRPEYFAGLYIAVVLLSFFLWHFLTQRRSDGISPQRQFLLVMISFVVLLVLSRVLLFTFDVINQNFAVPPFNDVLSSKFSIPFAAGAMLVTLLLDGGVGMIYAVVLSMFVGYLGRSPLLAAYALVSSLAAIYAVRQYRDRSAVLKASLIVGASNCVIVAGLTLLGERPNGWRMLIFDFGNAMVGGFFVAGLVSLLLPLFENVFDICTDVRLLELSNLNLPILRKLAAEAPGTYHHSILVGILAEAAAETIGANPLLARVACLYHDIGKIGKSSYYIENSKEATLRHSRLAPNMSSLVIIDHVKEGLAIAKQIRLPRRVTDIIPQHHGTSLVAYFYHKAKSDQDADEIGISEEQFRYPGPRPRSKESALIMLADSIEAAARTVESPNPKRLQNVVDRIVDRFLNDHQLDESQLTLNEIAVAKQAFTRTLSGIYHERIAYPGFDFSQVAVDEASSG